MKSVCLVRLSAMGDVVQSLAPVRSLVRARSDVEFHFVTQTDNVPLLDGIGVTSVIAYDRCAGLRGLLRIRRALREVAPGCVVDLQGNWKSALIARLSGAKTRIGAARSHRQEPSSVMLLNALVRIEGPRHPASIALCLLRELEPDLPAAASTTEPSLVATEQELLRVAGAVRDAGVDPDGPFSIFVVGHPADNRSWTIDAMRRQAALEPGPVVWLRGPGERDVALPEGVVTLTHGPGQLRELIALGTLARDGGGRVLGPDSGPTHVLSACGVETLAFYGPQDPERTAPPGARVLIRGDGPVCVPCRSRRCTHPDGSVCMAFTTADA